MTLVYCNQTVGWIKMKLSTKVGLDPGHIVLEGTQLPQKGARPPQFSAQVWYGQTAGRIKMPLGTEVGLGPGDIVLDGDPAPHTEGHSTPTFRPVSTVAKRSPSQLLLSTCLRRCGQKNKLAPFYGPRC